MFSVWVLSGFSSLIPQHKNMQYDDSTLFLSTDVDVNLLCNLIMAWQRVQGWSSPPGTPQKQKQRQRQKRRRMPGVMLSQGDVKADKTEMYGLK